MNVSEVSPGLFLTAPATRDGFSSLLGVDEDRVPQYLISATAQVLPLQQENHSQHAPLERQKKVNKNTPHILMSENH